MRAIIFKDCCALEEIMKDEEFKYYDKAIENERDEEAITFFENNYPDYCDIINIPDNITDYQYRSNDDYTEIVVVINGKIENLYFRGWDY